MNELQAQRNRDCISLFYNSFQQGDVEGMLSCYARDVVFSDPVFSELTPADARAMWRMLLDADAGLEVSFHEPRADDTTGHVRWEARYTFLKTGRYVHNIVDGYFEFRDGVMVRHTDTFDLWSWSRQALGSKGIFLGWTPFMQNAIRKESRKALDRYIQRSS